MTPFTVYLDCDRCIHIDEKEWADVNKAMGGSHPCVVVTDVHGITWSLSTSHIAAVRWGEGQ